MACPTGLAGIDTGVFMECAARSRH
jgi:hypothetical protein